MMATASSTDENLMEQWSSEMPSLTLHCAGLDRSTMSRNLPGWRDFGTRPNGLMWTS